MKLTCIKHGKRVHVLPSTNVIHRDSGSLCESNVRIGSFTGTGEQVVKHNATYTAYAYLRYADSNDDWLWERPVYME